MELIYTDANKKDIGVIHASSFDLAFGVDENDFEIEILKRNHCCVPGSVIYIEGEEYGGIVDNLELSSSSDMLKYIGRTFHGILNSKVIQPSKNCDYLMLYGDANQVLAELIELLDLSELFEAETVMSGIQITAYEMDRYIKGYDGIRKMLNSVSAKLKMKWQGRHIKLWAEPLIDYSVNEEFLLSAVTDMSIKKMCNPINHIIGLGSGDLAERKIIHVFTDENGGIMPYSQIDNPIKDSDYILDKRNQQLFAVDEICDIYDLSNAETVENYVLLKSQPNDWSKHFSNYFFMTNEEKYENVSADEQDFYSLLTSQPNDWSKTFSDYFIKVNTDYKSVEGSEKENYKRISSRPKDWKNNYGNYLLYYSDGVNSEYKSISGVTKYSYKKQTRRPTDWKTNFKTYFEKNKKGKFVALEKAKTWRTNRFYTKYSTTVAPKWNSNCYKKVITVSAPLWKSNTYYLKTKKTVIPQWKSNTYYRKEFDNYAAVVKGCIEKLETAWNSDKVDITLKSDKNYDVGDIVGGVDDITGLFAARQITKKIVKRNSYGDYEISYEEGISI